MQCNEQKGHSFFSIILGLLSFIFGFFVIYLIVKNFKGRNKSNEKLNSCTLKEINEEKSFLPNNRETNVSGFNLNERQSKILQAIQIGKEMIPSDIYKLEPDVSTRTLRRDMDVLVELGVVRQDGSTKSTKYIYVG